VRGAALSPNVSFALLACANCAWYVSFVSSTPTDIGRQIRKARAALGLSQIALAERAGCAPRSLQAWESGDRTPRLGALTALAAALDQDAAYFYGDGDPTGNDAPVAA
jgi:DNA-binding XRE family transcriptional regulator